MNTFCLSSNFFLTLGRRSINNILDMRRSLEIVNNTLVNTVYNWDPNTGPVPKFSVLTMIL